MQLSASKVRGYLLEQIIILSGVDQGLGSHVRDIFGEQGMHQTDEFTSGKDEGTFVLMFGYFMVLAPKVSLVLQVELAQAICPHDEVIATIGIADFGHAGVLRDEASTGTFRPGNATVLSQVFVFRETVDIDNLGQ